MSSPEKNVDSKADLSASELLKLYDELTAINAASAFVMQALAVAFIRGEGLDERSTTGAVFCAQWINERAVEMEQRLKDIVARAYGSTTTTSS